jgi:hypothetical protein
MPTQKVGLSRVLFDSRGHSYLGLSMLPIKPCNRRRVTGSAPHALSREVGWLVKPPYWILLPGASAASGPVDETGRIKQLIKADFSCRRKQHVLGMVPYSNRVFMST